MKTLREYIDLIDTAQNSALDKTQVKGSKNDEHLKEMDLSTLAQLGVVGAGLGAGAGLAAAKAKEWWDSKQSSGLTKKQIVDKLAKKQGVKEEELGEIDRRGFLKAMGAGAALAGAGSLGANTAFAQNMPDINKQKLDLANKYYAALVQRAKEDGLPLDARTTNMLKAKAEEMSQRNIQQAQSNSAFSGSQSSEIQRSKMYNQFEEDAAPDAVRRIEQLVQYK